MADITYVATWAGFVYVAFVIDAFACSVGDSYDNALAETIIGLFKTEVVRRRGPWRNIDPVECATLEWGDWFNSGRRRAFVPRHRRLSHLRRGSRRV